MKRIIPLLYTMFYIPNHVTDMKEKAPDGKKDKGTQKQVK